MSFTGHFNSIGLCFDGNLYKGSRISGTPDSGIRNPQFVIDRHDEPVDDRNHITCILLVHRAGLVPDHFFPQ